MPPAVNVVGEVATTTAAVSGILSSLADLLMHLGSLGKNGQNTVAFKIGHTIGQIAPVAHTAADVLGAVTNPNPGQ
jgi:hypothetical protein